MARRRKEVRDEMENVPGKDDKPKKGGGFRIVLIILLLILLTIIIVQNLAKAPLVLLFWRTNLPVIAIILIFTMFGFVLGVLVQSIIISHRRKRKEKEARKQGLDEDDEEEEF